MTSLLRILLLYVQVIFLGSCSNTDKVTQTVALPDDPTTLLETDNDYVNDQYIFLEDRVYRDSIKTVQLFPSGDPLSYPIIPLNSPRPLELHFDDLGNEFRQYYYRLYHCDAEWNRSDIIEMQYIEGFFSDLIDDYDMSFNTLRPFVHYSVSIPSPNMKIKASGNYVLVVLENDQLDRPVLTKRFMVVDERVAIVANAKRSSVVDERNYKQLIDFEIHHASLVLNNPFRDIKVTILQNNRWDRTITDLQPIFLKDKILEYRYDRGNEFWAGNEFRAFNISSTRFINEDVVGVFRDGDRLVAQLTPDKKRTISGYRTDRDINGRYLVRNAEGFNDIIESDYVDVQFQLDWFSAFGSSDVYVFGALTNWRLDKQFKMRYDYQAKAYKCVAPLKQGYYEYQYVTVNDRNNLIDETVVEGSYFEAENDYTILVYFKDLSLDYDRLIGAHTFSTRNSF